MYLYICIYIHMYIYILVDHAEAGLEVGIGQGLQEQG